MERERERDRERDIERWTEMGSLTELGSLVKFLEPEEPPPLKMEKSFRNSVSPTGI